MEKRGLTLNFPTPTKMTALIHVNELEEVHKGQAQQF